MKKFKNILLVLFVALLIAYFIQPTLSYGFIGLPVSLIILIGVWIFSDNFTSLAMLEQTGFTIKNNSNKSIKVLFAALFVLLIYTFAFPLLVSSAIFRTDEYRDLIGNVETGKDLSHHMLPISLDRIRVVDESLAQILGDKVLGSQSALGSQVTLGKFNIQKVNNQLYWVAPLMHSGFFKWQKNIDGTPGYVMVNATNERDVKLVQEINGKPIKIKYQSEAYFFDNLERYVYFKGYFNVGLTDYSFEIDEAGNPYWVITKFKKTIGFEGDDAEGVILVNAQTGEISDYTIKDTPKWVDRIQPAQFIEKQLNDWGNYVKGYWNFSNENKLKTTQELSLVYGNDNEAYWYTGLTSVGADEATVGFVLVNTRSKKAVWYKQSGATEFAAQNSAKGKVQEKGFSATLPIPYNINNIPTYVMTLKDNGGLVKMYAMVAIEDYTIVGVGNTLTETLMAYKNAFNMAGNKINPKSDTEKKIICSIITRLNGDVKNGNTYYYFKLKDSPKIFIGSTQISNDFPVTNIGDSIQIAFDNDNQDVIDVTTFKNRSIR
jgi:hypothetical protein